MDPDEILERFDRFTDYVGYLDLGSRVRSAALEFLAALDQDLTISQVLEALGDRA